MKISENIKMLQVDDMNPVLVWDEKSLAIIDTGYPRHTNELIQAIADAGHDAKNLTHIILTHQDIDHVGCVSRLLEIAPNAKVYAHKDEAPYMDGTRTPIKLANRLAERDNCPPEERAEIDKYAQRFGEIHFNVDVKLDDSDVIDVAGGIVAVHTPGHSPGHACYFLRDAQIMVLGDSAGVVDGEITSFNPVWVQDIALADKAIDEIIKPYPKKGVVGHHSGYTPL